MQADTTTTYLENLGWIEFSHGEGGRFCVDNIQHLVEDSWSIAGVFNTEVSLLQRGDARVRPKRPGGRRRIVLTAALRMFLFCTRTALLSILFSNNYY